MRTTNMKEAVYRGKHAPNETLHCLRVCSCVCICSHLLVQSALAYRSAVVTILIRCSVPCFCHATPKCVQSLAEPKLRLFEAFVGFAKP